MLPTDHKFPFSDPEWIFEPKWDGYRALCVLENKTVRFISRNDKELTKRFPDLSTLGHAIKAKSAILDGEIVALDEHGRPIFEALQNRRKFQIVYFAFDLLTLNGNDLRDEPLIKRKAALKRIVKPAPRLRLTDYVVEDGLGLFAAVTKLGLEGMVAKRADSLYESGRTKQWLKIKTKVGKETMKKRVETWGR